MKLINLTLVALLFVLSSCNESVKSGSIDNNQDVAIEETTSPVAKEKVVTPKELDLNDEKKLASETVQNIVVNMVEKFNLSEEQQDEVYDLMKSIGYENANEERQKNIRLKIEEHIKQKY